MNWRACQFESNSWWSVWDSRFFVFGLARITSIVELSWHGTFGICSGCSTSIGVGLSTYARCPALPLEHWVTWSQLWGSDFNGLIAGGMFFFVSFWMKYLSVFIDTTLQFGILFVHFRVPTRSHNEWWYPIPCAKLITALWVILIRFGEDRFRFFTAVILSLMRCSCRVCSAGFSKVFSYLDAFVLFWWLLPPPLPLSPCNAPT